jgi:hypothetical protein
MWANMRAFMRLIGGASPLLRAHCDQEKRRRALSTGSI